MLTCFLLEMRTTQERSCREVSVGDSRLVLASNAHTHVSRVRTGSKDDSAEAMKQQLRWIFLSPKLSSSGLEKTPEDLGICWSERKTEMQKPGWKCSLEISLHHLSPLGLYSGSRDPFFIVIFQPVAPPFSSSFVTTYSFFSFYSISLFPTRENTVKEFTEEEKAAVLLHSPVFTGVKQILRNTQTKLSTGTRVTSRPGRRGG